MDLTRKVGRTLFRVPASVANGLRSRTTRGESPPRHIVRLVRTLPHLKPWQVLGRVVAPVRRRVTRLPEPPAYLDRRLQSQTAFLHHDPWNRRENLLRGQFTFLNETDNLGWPPGWEVKDRSLLWAFNLHYFNYLHLLEKGEQKALCLAWTRAHPDPHPVAWHPYPISLRLVNWARAGLQDPAVHHSFYRQAAYLYRNVETHVYGNHLLENARALVLAGSYFRGQGEADEWTERGLAIYRAETPEQILYDGFHFERSPMYHALVLEGYLDVLNVLAPHHPDRSYLEVSARRMTDTLISVVHPDGMLTLFNDATQEIAPAPSVLVDYARRLLDHKPESQPAFPDAGYFLHRNNDVFLMIDGGKPGPEYLMAHAHADIFSFELSIQGRPLIVDTGVYQYEPGPMRDYVRSTRAHNTVTVDGENQIECWGSFRVARRAEPHDVECALTEKGIRFQGTFSGYAKLLGDDIQHHRRISVDDDTRQITVKDWVEGHGEHVVESRLHVHPDVTLTETSSGFMLENEGVHVQLSTEGAPTLVKVGWYCPRFGVRERNDVVVLGGPSMLPTGIVYRLEY